MVAGENSTEELKRQHQALKTASVKSRMESIDSTLSSDLLRSVNQSRDKGANSGIPSAMPCHAKREGSWRRDTMVFVTYLPHLLVRFAPTLKSNHNYNLSIMSDSTSEER